MKKNLIKSLAALALIAVLIGLTWSGYRFIIHRTELARWSLEQAELDADHDIKAGTMKIYLHGSFAAYAVGVDEVNLSLVEKLPRAEAGVGCVISDMEVFDAQGEYAAHYNKAIVQHLQGRAAMAVERQ